MTEKEFQLLEMLVEAYERETIFSSRHEVDHPYHRTIVAWGKLYPQDIIPWLIKRCDSHKGWITITALSAIVGEKEKPRIPEKYAGRFDKLLQLWLEWGKAKGYLTA
jgi:hypothetical protein